MVNLKLKVSKASYEEKLNKLKDLANRLDNKITVFQKYKTDTAKFIEETDDNYGEVINNIDANIEACRKAHERVEDSIKFVQDTLTDMEDVSVYGGKILGDAVDIAKDSLANAVDAVSSSLKTIL